MNSPKKANIGYRKNLLKLQNIKSAQSIQLINKLHRSLYNLEEKCNENIAKKYLIGFLEEKGVNSYEEFINSLT